MVSDFSNRGRTKLVATSTESIMTALYYVCPNLEWLNIKGQAASGVPVSAEYQVAATAYGLLYAGLLLFGACRIFEHRDF